ncbi:hypothetical protein LTR10_021936 [Elasticomyces elasticus]|nr:hypothetical protein LTR10_021936 [Elasticomyces elasticus]
MSPNGFGALPRNASEAIKPWKVDVPQQDLDKLATLLKYSELAPPTYENSLPGQDRRLGVRRDWLSSAKHYLGDRFQLEKT